ncbi:NAD-dependent epimerase/dehydratase family protein [Maricaulis maris]|uniref:Nucleoside-diphosphate-sugar epimerase n=1 Tax=Maricaulis maris TaxID=74318 RepID=A0A495DMQ5_9PROT|nr:NAD(P)-dependent oxidoreductase [Maricaulis maris]RKR03218.1 nucleoside-diphosphate-sugar epimerase [Maricaulis maris]
MRVLVTGATGFLGQHLTRALRARGNEVVALGRDRAKLDQLSRLGCEPLAHDLASGPPQLTGSLDACVHAAALSSPWGTDTAFRRANIDGTRHALALARSAGVKRFVQISSPSVYFRFADQIAVAETSGLPDPVNAYARTKRAAEDLVLDAAELDPVILRPRGLYGAGDTALLPRLLRAAERGPLPLMRGGGAVTDLTHVEDVVSAILTALDAPPRPAQRLFNISGGQALAIREIVESAAARHGVTVRWRALPVPLVLAAARMAETGCARLPGRPEPPVTAYGVGLFAFSQTLDLSAARKVLGWQPQIGFSEGLDRTFAGVAAA